jgi:hypothetical protein
VRASTILPASATLTKSLRHLISLKRAFTALSASFGTDGFLPRPRLDPQFTWLRLAVLRHGLKLSQGLHSARQYLTNLEGRCSSGKLFQVGKGSNRLFCRCVSSGLGFDIPQPFASVQTNLGQAVSYSLNEVRRCCWTLLLFHLYCIVMAEPPPNRWGLRLSKLKGKLSPLRRPPEVQSPPPVTHIENATGNIVIGATINGALPSLL